MSCRLFLSWKGYEVTVLEKREKAGGMMTFGIPPYAASRGGRRRDKSYRKFGSENNLWSGSGAERISLSTLFEEGFSAIYIATGAWKGMKLGIEGEDHPRVWDGLRYLVSLNQGDDVPEAENVVVIGGATWP